MSLQEKIIENEIRFIEATNAALEVAEELEQFFPDISLEKYTSMNRIIIFNLERPYSQKENQLRDIRQKLGKKWEYHFNYDNERMDFAKLYYYVLKSNKNVWLQIKFTLDDSCKLVEKNTISVPIYGVVENAN